MMHDMVWIIGVSDTKKEIFSDLTKKFITVDNRTPKQFPRYDALRYAKLGYVKIIYDREAYEIFRQNGGYKVLITRWHGIGDVILLEPHLRKLSEYAELTIYTGFPEILEYAPFVSKDRLHYIDLHDERNVKGIPDDKYSHAFHLTGYSERHEEAFKTHRTDIFGYNFSHTLTVDEKEPMLYFGEKEKGLVRRKSGMRYIGLQYDASTEKRMMNNFEKVAESILLSDEKNIVVIFGHKGTCDFNGKRIVNLDGKTTVKQAMCTIRDLDAMVANDSGLMHVALSMRIPTVCVFGMIKPDLRLRYYQGERAVVAPSCVGCNHVCDNMKCLNPNTEEIVNAIKSFKYDKNKRYEVRNERDIENVRDTEEARGLCQVS